MNKKLPWPCMKTKPIKTEMGKKLFQQNPCGFW